MVAISAQDRTNAGEMVDRKQVRYPIGYGFDPEEAAERFGAYLSEGRDFIQATAFLLRNGRIEEATYSTGPLGRMEANHVVGHVRYMTKKEREAG